LPQKHLRKNAGEKRFQNFDRKNNLEKRRIKTVSKFRQKKRSGKTPDKNGFKIPTEKTVWKFSPAKTLSKNARHKNDSEIKRVQKNDDARSTAVKRYPIAL